MDRLPSYLIGLIGRFVYLPRHKVALKRVCRSIKGALDNDFICGWELRQNKDIALYRDALHPLEPHSLELVQYYQTGPYAFNIAALAGKLDVLKWMHERYWLERHYVLWGKNGVLFPIIRRCYFEIAQWLHQRYKITREELMKNKGYFSRLLCNMILQNRLDMFDWFRQTFEISWGDLHTRGFLLGRLMVESGNLPLLKWVHQRLTIEKKDIVGVGYHSGAITAIMNRRREILVWFRDEFGVEWKDIPDRSLLLRQLSIKSKLDTLQLIHQVFVLSKEDLISFNSSALTVSCSYGKDHILRWIIDTFSLTREELLNRDNILFRIAAINGHINILLILHQLCDITREEAMARDNEALILSEKNDRPNTVEWLKRTYGI